MSENPTPTTKHLHRRSSVTFEELPTEDSPNTSSQLFTRRQSSASMLFIKSQEGGDQQQRRSSDAEDQSEAAELLRPFIPELALEGSLIDEVLGRVRFVPCVIDVALAFIDISGYSKLAARLQDQGVHALAGAVNHYFAGVVAIVREYNGDVLKFAGDAIMVVWYGDGKTLSQNVVRALCCCQKLQEEYSAYVVPEATDCELTLHIGISCGPMKSQVFQPSGLSDADNYMMPLAFHFVGGAPLRQIEAVVDSAKPHEICCTKEVADLAGKEIIEVVPVSTASFEEATEVVKVKSVKIQCRQLPGKGSQAAEDQLNVSLQEKARAPLEVVGELFLPPSLLLNLRLGLEGSTLAEMRNLIVFFIKKSGNSVDVSDWFSEVHGEMIKYGCPITQIIDDDKGVHVVAAMNLFVSRDGAADSAMELCRHLLNAVDCCIGLAAGTCFCGSVGSAESCRWDITGNVVVRACRLMQYAATNPKDGLVKAVIDESVVQEMSNPTAVAKFDEIQIKGTSDPIPVFGICRAEYYAVANICAITYSDFASEVREKERKIIKENVIQREELTCGCTTIVGGCLMGKKYTVFSALNQSKFMQILHTSSKWHAKFGIAQTLCGWFSAKHWSQTIRDLSQQANEAWHNRMFTRALTLLDDLLYHVIDGENDVAFVIDAAQHLDDTSLRFIAESIRKYSSADGEMSSPFGRKSSSFSAAVDKDGKKQEQTKKKMRGRWLWFLCLTPILSGVSSEKVESMIPQVIPIVHLGPMTTLEVQGMFRNFALWWLNDHLSEVYTRAVGGVTGLLKPLMMHLAPKIVGSMMQNGTSYEWNYIAPTRQGYMSTSDKGVDLFLSIRPDRAFPSFTSKFVGHCDMLHPRQRLLLRIIATVAVDNTSVPMPLAIKLGKKFLGCSGPTVQSDLRMLKLLFILDYEDVAGSIEAPSPSHRTDTSSGMDSVTVRFRQLPMQSFLMSTLSPPQIFGVAKVAAGYLLQPEFHQPTNGEHLFLVARLFFMGKNVLQCVKFLREAWKIYVAETFLVFDEFPIPSEKLPLILFDDLGYHIARLIDQSDNAIQASQLSTTVAEALQHHALQSQKEKEDQQEAKKVLSKTDGDVLEKKPGDGSKKAAEASSDAKKPSAKEANTQQPKDQKQKDEGESNKKEEVEENKNKKEQQVCTPDVYPMRPLKIQGLFPSALQIKNLEPALVLGPLGGMLLFIGWNLCKNILIAAGGGAHFYAPQIFVEDYLVLLKKFRAAVYVEESSLMTESLRCDVNKLSADLSYEDEEKKVRSFLKTFSSLEEGEATASEFLNYYNTVMRARARVLPEFASGVQNVACCSQGFLEEEEAKKKETEACVDSSCSTENQKEEETGCPAVAFQHFSHLFGCANPKQFRSQMKAFQTCIHEIATFERELEQGDLPKHLQKMKSENCVRQIFLHLASVNWNPPYPHLNPKWLRNDWNNRWINLAELKAILFLFILHGCGSALEITSRRKHRF